jgi:hypothetical protein
MVKCEIQFRSGITKEYMWLDNQPVDSLDKQIENFHYRLTRGGLLQVFCYSSYNDSERALCLLRMDQIEAFNRIEVWPDPK